MLTIAANMIMVLTAKWPAKWLLLLMLSSSDHPFWYLSYETEAHCEAAGEEIKALSTFRVWPTANIRALYSLTFRIATGRSLGRR